MATTDAWTPMHSPLFTVILAGYQTEPYLPKALDSIAQQGFDDYEAICYVEQSTDNSLAICQEMASRNPHFKVATAPKSGAVATTRNYGIDHASGEYLVVLDGDDWLAPDTLAKLADKLRQTGPVDVLAFAAITTEAEEVDWKTAPRLTNFRPSDAAESFTGQEAIRRTGRNRGRLHCYTWLAAYRTAFLREHKLYQKDGMLMEDFEWMPRVWFVAEKIAYLDEPLYAYRRRPNSLTTEASSRIIYDLARHFRSLAEFASEHSVPGDILAIWSNQWLAVLYWFLYHPVTSRKISDADRRQAWRIIREGGGWRRFRRLSRWTSLPRRAALPLVALAAIGWQWPARLYFRRLYFPLAERRGKEA